MKNKDEIMFEKERELQDLKVKDLRAQDFRVQDLKVQDLKVQDLKDQKTQTQHQTIQGQKNKEINHHGQDGFVYAMRSIDMMEGRYKVGMTKRHPSIRAKELSTSYENDLEVCLMVKVSNRREAEKKIFELLDEYMPSDNKEIVDVQCLSILDNIFEYVRQRYPIDGEGIKIRVTRTIKL